MEELRQAYEAAGGLCRDWIQDDVVESAIESGSCGDEGVLMLFAGPDEAEAQAMVLQDLYEESGLDAIFLYGANWIANVDDAREVAQTLGGTVIDSPAGTDTSDASTPVAEEDAPVIESGTWLVGSEIQPGVYRVAGYYARLDANGEIIDNDGAYGENDLTLLVVKRSDDMVEINGQALAVEYLPQYDPIENGARSGIYLVGKDIAPGRYRIKEPDYAYAARLDKNLEIIDNEGNAGNVVITIRPSDYAFAFTGEITPL